MEKNINNIIERKEEIRKEINRRLREQDPLIREEKSGKIQKKLLTLHEFQACRTVMLYVSLPAEVDTRGILEEALKQGKRVVVPYIGRDSREITASELKAMEYLEKGPLGIFQPGESFLNKVPLKEIDLIVVPGIAYDKKNMRLGRGKGYYDRFLSNEELLFSDTIGIAFSFQVVDALPVCPHDRPVSMVITD
ncbi:MAG: 5-formyltetrahydrofolate cyclo-ligase [Candidatus Omnitrophota bacterium]